jgi:hypothetical protein
MSSILPLVSDQLTVPAKKPRRTTKATAPPIVEESFIVEKTNYSPPVEGFQASIRKTRSFPVYVGPSIYFNRTIMDDYYKQYDADNLQPNPEMVSMLNNMPVEPPELPNFGAMLSKFDAGSITSIPWDADNASYLQSDIVWGQVTDNASKSIFMKSYHEALFSDPTNISIVGDRPLYVSAMFPVVADSPGAALFLQLSDAVGAVAGQMAVSYVSDVIERRFKNAFGNQLVANLDKAIQSRAKYIERVKANPSLYSRVADYTNNLRGITDDPVMERLLREKAEIQQIQADFKQTELDAINSKKAAKTPLTPAEELTKAASSIDEAKKGGAIAAEGTKVATNMDAATKIKMPGKMGTRVGTAMKEVMERLFLKALREFIAEQTAKRGIIYGILAVMNAVFGAAAVVTAGIMGPFLAIVAAMTSAYSILDSVCMVLTMALMVILPTFLDKALENGGVCPDGTKPIDQIITDEFLYFLFSTFCPIGGLMDVFGPYVCYATSGEPTMKKALYIPSYFSDSTLSISKHNWSTAETPRGDSTTFISDVPPGWPIVAGIAREPCAPGTWTSSEVDMLCNISTYVPKTYPKRSMVPPTVVKGSKVPITRAKDTYMATRVKDLVRQVQLPRYRACPPGLRDSSLIPGGIGDCWDDLKCNTRCWGDWNPAHWGCNTSCSGTGGIASGQHFYDRQECSAGFVLAKSLCRTECPGDKPATIDTDLFCTGTCGAEETTWLAFCTGNTDGWCSRNAAANGKTGTNWKSVAGVCWQNCEAGQIDVGALCRDGCEDDENEVLGVCWKRCPDDTTDIGALCRYNCSGDTPHDVAGVCWGGCGNDIDVGALCREHCREGYHEVAGVCWGNIGTYARGSKIPKSVKIYDPGYNPKRTKEELTIPWCDFGSDIMLDRMAQFYYEQSTLNPQQLEEGRISYEYIVQFYGVIASSELSCDVACQIKTVVFDPVTGGRYEETLGTTYPDDPGNQVSYRRFYFINIDAASAKILADNAATNPTLYNKAWPADPQGLFTVTGCTNADSTAPNAMIKSTDTGVDPVASLPKIFRVSDKANGATQFAMASFLTSATTTAITTLVGAVPPIRRSRNANASAQPSMAQQVAGTVAGGLAGQAATNAINKAMNIKLPVGAAGVKKVIGPVNTDPNKPIFSINTESDNFSIDQGPIYECRARDNNGYFPNIEFCGKVNTTELLCSYPLILRDTIDLYHLQNPTLHIKTVTAIEPRGKDGCYYKFNTASYNPADNSEGNITTVREVVLRYEQKDKSTCVFTPTTTFVTDMAQYPVRSYYDINTKSMAYPTRKVTSTSTIEGRYIRIRPSQNGDGYIRLSQIGVYDSTGTNLALSRPVYTNAPAFTGSGPPNTIVDGTLACRSFGQGVWVGGNNKQTHYIDIDLGMNYFINYVMFFGQLDLTATENDRGIRIEVLYTNGAADTPQKQLLVTEGNRVEKVDFSTQIIGMKLPVKPFEVPRPLPSERNLGNGCASRCEDKNQIEAMINTYNTTNANSQIIKVIKAFTPTATRCDYQAEIVRKDGNVKTIGKENISFTVGSQVTNPTSKIYGKYVRIKAIPSPADLSAALPDPLEISQIVVKNAAGINVALGKKTFATINHVKSMNPAAYGISSLVTDGTLSERTAPNFWSSGIYGDMNIMVDLGINHDIVSVQIYGVAGTSYAGAVVEILRSANMNATPVYSTTLPAGQTTFTLQNFAACNFTYTQAAPAFTYIQDSTPLLDSVDTSGGILSFKGISDSIAGVFNSIVNDLKTANPLAVLNTSVNTANTTVSNIVAVAAANIQIAGCPNTKCSDPAILTSIANTYNTQNSANDIQYGAETNRMTQITKAGVSGPSTCDVMFTNLYNLYDDVLYPPTVSRNTTMVKRFTMTNTGNCALEFKPGSSVIDLSSNAIGIIPASSALSSTFNVPNCQVNCRDPALLASLKTRLNSTTSTGGITNFTSIMQSFAQSGSTCEYYMTKDVTKQNTRTKRTTTNRGLYTYVTANFTVNSSNCSFTLGSAIEADPDLITTQLDNITGMTTASLNGQPLKLPYLFNYDNTEPSSRVNETPLNL